MELFIFPAVFYKNADEEEYVAAFDDIEVFAVAKTIEETFKLAKHYLRVYCQLSYKMYGEVKEKPRTYLESVKQHPKKIVLLVDADVEKEKKIDGFADQFD